jgi:hypothetical protein
MRLIIHLHKIIRNSISEQLAASIFRVVQEGHKSHKIDTDMLILGFHLDVDEICALVRYNAA